MWLSICFYIVFVHVINTISVRDDTKTYPKAYSDPLKETEAIFAGVIKNISRVNNVLQELINNYEHLQKIYRSQENTESISSDDEIDEVFKSKKRSKFDVSTNSPGDNHFGATQVIWSDEEDNENERSEETASEEVEKDNKPQEVLATVSTTAKEPDTIDSNDSLLESKETLGVNIISKEKETETVSQTTPMQKRAEIFFVDTHTTTQKVTKRERSIFNVEINTPLRMETPRFSFSKVSDIPPKSTTRHSRKKKSKRKKTSRDNKSDILKASHNAPEYDIAKNTKPREVMDRNRNVEKKLYSETFSAKKIWDEIINNKPIQLEAYNEYIFKRTRKNNDEELNFKSVKGDTAEALVTDKNKGKYNERVSAITEDDSGREEFKAKVLRKAYGDACMKMVVRKCFKALKAAGKSVCVRYKCKTSYKEKFKEFTKTGCIKEFVKKDRNGENNEKDDNAQNLKNYKHKVGGAGNSKAVIVPLELQRGNEEPDLDSGSSEFPDSTRTEYFEACLPHIESELRELTAMKDADVESNMTNSFVVDPTTVNNFNILRDRFERACKKISNKKCVAACRYVTKEICESFPCSKAKKRAYRKSCKRQCKVAYQLRHDSSDSSDSSSDISSDSDSDSGTDSDTSTS